MAHNLSPWEVEAGGSELKVFLGSMRPFIERQKEAIIIMANKMSLGNLNKEI